MAEDAKVAPESPAPIVPEPVATQVSEIPKSEPTVAAAENVPVSVPKSEVPVSVLEGSPGSKQSPPKEPQTPIDAAPPSVCSKPTKPEAQQKSASAEPTKTEPPSVVPEVPSKIPVAQETKSQPAQPELPKAAATPESPKPTEVPKATAQVETAAAPSVGQSPTPPPRKGSGGTKKSLKEKINICFSVTYFFYLKNCVNFKNNKHSLFMYFCLYIVAILVL